MAGENAHTHQNGSRAPVAEADGTSNAEADADERQMRLANQWDEGCAEAHLQFIRRIAPELLAYVQSEMATDFELLRQGRAVVLEFLPNNKQQRVAAAADIGLLEIVAIDGWSRSLAREPTTSGIRRWLDTRKLTLKDVLREGRPAGGRSVVSVRGPVDYLFTPRP